MDRRQFLRAGIIGAGGAATLPSAAVAGAQAPGPSPYGSLDGIEPDENDVILPPGFTSRIVAIAGEPVGDTDYEWLAFPDGAATFDDGEGGWYHTVNSEARPSEAGGVSAIHFGPDGEILDAYAILEGSRSNCAGGPTPWGTWLSCEEVTGGLVWECDPTGELEAVSLPAMGLFHHEAAAVDPVGEAVYMTEDDEDGVLYRFRPAAYPDLSAGVLEAAIVAADGSVTWGEITDPSGETAPTSEQVETATPFIGGEGIWYHDGVVYFTTKSDHRVHALDVGRQRHEVIYEPPEDDAVLKGVDNITVDAGTGDLYVAEDGGNMEVVLLTPDGVVAAFARVVGHDDSSEITGPVFNPARDRLYFSSQNGPTPRRISDINPRVDDDGRIGGVTFEISGPFRDAVQDSPETTTTETTTSAEVTTSSVQSPATTLAQVSDTDDDGGGGGNGAAIGIGVGVAAAAVAGGAFVALRNRRSPETDAVASPADSDDGATGSS